MISKKLLIPLLGMALVGCGARQTLAAATIGYPPAYYFITQYSHPKYHPEPAPTLNANCGPTSLAMAITAYGKVPMRYQGDREALIEAVREAMTGAHDPGAWTYPSEFPKAAAQFGLQAELVRGVEQVFAELGQPGRMVVVNVNPTPAYASKLAYPFNGGHFALVTGFEGDQVFLNDPMASGPMTITRAQLQTALSTPLGPGIDPYQGGIAVWATR